MFLKEELQPSAWNQSNGTMQTLADVLDELFVDVFEYVFLNVDSQDAWPLFKELVFETHSTTVCVLNAVLPIRLDENLKEAFRALFEQTPYILLAVVENPSDLYLTLLNTNANKCIERFFYPFCREKAVNDR